MSAAPALASALGVSEDVAEALLDDVAGRVAARVAAALSEQVAAVTEAAAEAAAEAARLGVEEVLARELHVMQARVLLGHDLPLTLDQIEQLLPFSRKTLYKLRKRRLIRLLKLPDVDRPFATIGAVLALIRSSKPE